jgi:hypothetical protein
MHAVYKKEKAARDACEARIRKMEMEIEPRNEQERVYRENQEQLRRKLVESRDRLILMLQEAQRMREVLTCVFAPMEICITLRIMC